MSFSCPFDDTCKDDVAVNLLRSLFGDNFVDSFLFDTGTSPAQVALANDTIMSLTLNALAYMAVTSAILLAVIGLYKWVTDSANDGEAVGLSERGSLLGMWGRPIFSIIMLAPTASGYPTICLLIMTVVLWSNSATNRLYEKVTLNDISVTNINEEYLDSDLFKQSNDLADAYVKGVQTGYCLSVLENNGADLEVLQYAPKKNEGVTEYKTYYVSRTGFFKTKSAPLCGTFTAKKYSQSVFITPASNKLQKSVLYDDMIKIQEQQSTVLTDILNNRTNAAAQAYIKGIAHSMGSQQTQQLFAKSGFATANQMGMFLVKSSSPISIPIGIQPWDIDMTKDTLTNPATLKTIIPNADKQSENLRIQIETKVRNTVLNDGSGYNYAIRQATDNIKKSMLSTGWLNAGVAQATIRQLRATGKSNLADKTYNAEFNLGIYPDEAEEIDISADIITHINTIASAIGKTIANDLPRTHPAQISLLDDISIASLEDGSQGKDITDNLASSMSAPYHSLNKNAVAYIVNNDDGQGALTHIQDFGELLLAITGFGYLAIISIRTLLLAIAISTTVASRFPLIGKVGEAGNKINSALKDFIDSVFLQQFNNLLDSFFLLSRIFGVVIPSMPYIFLIMAGVGWFVQIIQTMFGMPLWLIMHAIPEKSFIGSQQQGYVTLLSLLFRPILILSGFYIAFTLYDPLVVYATRAFFDSYGSISGATSSSSISEFFIYLGSIKYWYYLYAGMLMGITYFVFGLVQELSDSVLDWLGTNLLRGFGNMENKGAIQGASAGMAQSARQASQDRKNAANEAQRKKEKRQEQQKKEEEEEAKKSAKGNSFAYSYPVIGPSAYNVAMNKGGQHSEDSLTESGSKVNGNSSFDNPDTTQEQDSNNLTNPTTLSKDDNQLVVDTDSQVGTDSQAGGSDGSPNSPIAPQVASHDSVTDTSAGSSVTDSSGTSSSTGFNGFNSDTAKVATLAGGAFMAGKVASLQNSNPSTGVPVGFTETKDGITAKGSYTNNGYMATLSKNGQKIGSESVTLNKGILETTKTSFDDKGAEAYSVVTQSNATNDIISQNTRQQFPDGGVATQSIDMSNNSITESFSNHAGTLTTQREAGTGSVTQETFAGVNADGNNFEKSVKYQPTADGGYSFATDSSTRTDLGDGAYTETKHSYNPHTDSVTSTTANFDGRSATPVTNSITMPNTMLGVDGTPVPIPNSSGSSNVSGTEPVTNLNHFRPALTPASSIIGSNNNVNKQTAPTGSAYQNNTTINPNTQQQVKLNPVGSNNVISNPSDDKDTANQAVTATPSTVGNQNTQNTTNQATNTNVNLANLQSRFSEYISSNGIDVAEPKPTVVNTVADNNQPEITPNEPNNAGKDSSVTNPNEK